MPWRYYSCPYLDYYNLEVYTSTTAPPARCAQGGSVGRGPIRFSQETVIGALMALCPHIHWSEFQWPTIEDLLIDDLQTRDDWQGQAFGPSLVGPIERAAISLHGFQQAGAAAAAKAMPPLIPFGVGDERHFELAMDLKSQPTPVESMGVVDDDLLFVDSWVHHYEPPGST